MGNAKSTFTSTQHNSQTVPELAAAEIETKHSTHVEEKVVFALKEIQRLRNENHTPTVHFNRVVLNFPKIQKTFVRMRKTFAHFDKDGNGTLDYKELKDTMARLHTQLNDDEIKEIFNEVDVYHDGKINFKEFVTCIAVAYVLGMIPELEKGKPTTNKGNMSPLKLKRSASTFYGASKSISDAFELAIDMYRAFDTDCKGSICHRDMETVLNRAQQSSPSKCMRKHRRGSGVGMPTGGPVAELLAQDRWKEMDWDKNGRITFQEFIFTFVRWVSDSADDDFDEGDAHSHKPRSASLTGFENTKFIVDRALYSPRVTETEKEKVLAKPASSGEPAPKAAAAAVPAGETDKGTTLPPISTTPRKDSVNDKPEPVKVQQQTEEIKL